MSSSSYGNTTPTGAALMPSSIDFAALLTALQKWPLTASKNKGILHPNTTQQVTWSGNKPNAASWE